MQMHVHITIARALRWGRTCLNSSQHQRKDDGESVVFPWTNQRMSKYQIWTRRIVGAPVHAAASPGEKLGYVPQRGAACTTRRSPRDTGDIKGLPSGSGSSRAFGGRPKIEFAREEGANGWGAIVRVVATLRARPQLRFML